MISEEAFLVDLETLCLKYGATKPVSLPYITWREGPEGAIVKYRVYHVCFRVPIKEKGND